MQTHEGALKVLAKKRDMTLDELMLKLETYNFCYLCQQWKLHSEFGIDRSRFNGLNRKCHDCRRKDNPNTTPWLGKPSPFRGRKHTPEASVRMSEARKGNQNRTGKPTSETSRKLISIRTREKAARGISNGNWKGGITPHNHVIRNSVEYIDWRNAVYKRDNYTCRHCGDAQGGNLNAHHIKPFAKFPELRFEISNGITLCEPCHIKVHRKGT